jgi:tRNA modification GTPase
LNGYRLLPYTVNMNDTIAAIATPAGPGGIGIVRLSGPQAREIAGRIFLPRNPIRELQSHRLYLGHLVDPATGSVIDEVLLSVMKGPFSYTREDVVEINSHSGLLLLSKILEITIRTGARLAKPGEFTFRAFLNGRIDLTQAEAVMDLIHSRSEKGLLLAAREMQGGFGKRVEELRQKGIEILASLEAAIDFPEEVSAILADAETIRRVEEELLAPIQKLIDGYAQRKIWMEGVATVIVGRVNVGKSCLLNRLLNEERALVSPIPGTTRDIVESTLYLQGIPLRLMDTAGFRKGRGKIETLGIRMTEQRLSEADLVLVVIDRSRPLGREDIDLLTRTREKKRLVVLNKTDLPSRFGKETEERFLAQHRAVRMSALTGQGIDEFHKTMVEVLTSGDETPLPDAAPNLRQRTGLLAASDHFRAALRNLQGETPLEIIAADLQSGLDGLAEIVGKTTPEDVLDSIFSRFCIGK